MKKWIYSVAVGLTVLGLSACGGTGSSESTAAESVQAESSEDASKTVQADTETSADGQTEEDAEGTSEENMEIPNPMKEAESSQELSEIGVSMEAPAEGTDVQYYIISDVVGQISFTWKDHAFTYRGSAAAEDFSGIFEEFEQTETVFDAEGTESGIRVRATVSGGRLADWSTAEAKYTLYTPDPVSDEDMGALCQELAGTSVPAEK